tara:strand:- start:1090 stop:1695 length:606 start_codon:yes stop_codon:yes gene_type:complete
MNKRQIYNIKVSSTRVIEGLLTESKEFVFDSTGGPVKPNTRYSIYYTDDMKEIYMTGLFSSKKSKVIKKNTNPTLFSQYTDLRKPIKNTYPKPFVTNPSDDDYKVGTIQRFFTQKANDKSQPVIEINKDDFQKRNNLYKYTSVAWVISGLQSEVERENSITMRTEETILPGISKVLFPLQYWKPSEGSKQDMENKLKRLKK